MKLASHCGIKFGSKVSVGWETLFMDTDFHRIKSVDGNRIQPYGEIVIGDECWLGAKCVIMKNTHLPNHTIVASSFLLNKSYDCAEKSLLAGLPAWVVKTEMYRDFADNKINYNLESKQF